MATNEEQMHLYGGTVRLVINGATSPFYAGSIYVHPVGRTVQSPTHLLNMDPLRRAGINRAIRNIQTELEFLAENKALTQVEFSAISNLIPACLPASVLSGSARSHGPSTGMLANTHLTAEQLNADAHQLRYQNLPAPSPVPMLPAAVIPVALPVPAAQPPPPVYAPVVVATATALYAYSSPDVGDLQLQPNDEVQVTEWMNADWAKGSKVGTTQEGIFPRSYIKVHENKYNEKQGMAQQPGPMSYGNMPMAVAQGSGEMQQQQPAGAPSKMNENGKKFGKKLGNAAIFGAGATIGGNIVNSIF